MSAADLAVALQHCSFAALHTILQQYILTIDSRHATASKEMTSSIDFIYIYYHILNRIDNEVEIHGFYQPSMNLIYKFQSQLVKNL